MSQVPEVRIRACNAAAIRDDAPFVLYWMIAARRTHSNFALDRAVEWAVRLRKPLVIFEPLRIGYRWASDRMHRFVIDGMSDTRARIDRLNERGVCGVRYFPYVEPAADADKGLLPAFARHACVIIPRDAIRIMIELNNRYALDGRDPNSWDLAERSVTELLASPSPWLNVLAVV